MPSLKEHFQIISLFCTRTNEKQQEELQQMIDEGLVKFFLPPNGVRKEWIISRDAMFIWFGEPRISKE
ncbi:hypothetical protein PVK73_27500 [Bacillus thuringiensis]